MTQYPKYLAVALLLTGSTVPVLALHSGNPDAAAGLSWLAGCWQGGSDSRVIEEQWMRPRNTVMLGSARVSSGGAVKEIEFVELRMRGDSVDYIVIPVGQRRTTFSGRMTGARAFVVTNPTNDFPTSVGYELVSRDSLSAWIEGKDGAQTRRLPYVYHRVPCEER